MNKDMRIGYDTDGENNISASSPRTTVPDNDGSLAKKPKLESNSDGDEVSQLTKLKHQSYTHIVINLED